jgi:hypothetical protein
MAAPGIDKRSTLSAIREMQINNPAENLATIAPLVEDGEHHSSTE